MTWVSMSAWRLVEARAAGPGRELPRAAATAAWLGAVLFVILLGAVAVLGAVIAVRLWWQRRRLKGTGATSTENRGDIIEVEYRVIDDRDP